MFRIDQDSKAYWAGAAEGRLMIARCDDCGHWIHPPRHLCPACRGDAVTAQPVSGRGTVYTFTVPAQGTALWIELVEQARLIVIGALVGGGEVAIGDPVEVRFEPAGDHVVPAFAKVAA